ncbi:RNA polymerase sigma factor [Variovorax sp.]|jgi:RNA polymerase sigma factor (sigma-70 family)|uniref:RNA polymerase sigma factor n=1 Tax=Variovorax sp. TaxID=1871043 RepID=UPI0037DA32BF
MPDSLRSTLRLRLTARYAELRRSLERIVGSRDDAADALQETWVRLEATATAGSVRNADAYLLRMAANIAIDTHRHNNVLLTDGDVEELMNIADEVGDPLRTVAARSELATLDAVLAEMPPRRRAILIAARMDGLLNTEIAERFGISESSVEKELRHAMRHCRERMAQSDAVERSSVAGRRRY